MVVFSIFFFQSTGRDFFSAQCLTKQTLLPHSLNAGRKKSSVGAFVCVFVFVSVHFICPKQRHMCKKNCYCHIVRTWFILVFYSLIHLYQVEDEDLTAVYENLPRAHQRISSFPSASAWGISESPELHDTLLLGSEGWEIHTDEETGKEYYYHPSTGRSTWDYPLSSSMESEVGAKDFPVSPTSSLSPACSPTDEARRTSGWEKVLDERSGRHYFFNPISGQSSWDPPDDLLTPPLSANSLQEGAPV